MITEAGLNKALGIFSLMKFFPGDDGTRAALGEMLCEMCHGNEEIIWLARRVQKLHREWPGAHEIRAAYCSKFQPRDGIEADSNVYLDGIPSETGRLEFETPQLSAGNTHLQIVGRREPVKPTDPVVVEVLAEVVEAATMPAAPKARDLGLNGQRVDRELKRMMGELPDPPPRPPQVITQADVDAVLEQQRHARIEAKRLIDYHLAAFATCDEMLMDLLKEKPAEVSSV